MSNKTISIDVILSSVFEDTALPIAETVLFTFTAVVGAVGNSLVVLFVLLRPSMRITRHVFMTNLAIGNLIMSVTLIPFVFLPIVTSKWPYGNASCKAANAFSGTNVFCSAFTIVAIAVDRYRYVRSVPANRMRMPTALGICGAMWLASLGFTLPIAVFHSTTFMQVPVSYFEANLNATITDPLNRSNINFPPRCSFEAPRSVRTTLACIQYLFTFVLPFVTILAFNAALHRVIAQRCMFSGASSNSVSRRRRRKCDRENRRVNLLLISVALSYGLLWLPFTVFSFLEDFFHEILLRVQNVKLWDLRLQWLAYCSLCTNPFLYGFFNSNFRREFNGVVSRRARTTTAVMPHDDGSQSLEDQRSVWLRDYMSGTKHNRDHTSSLRRAETFNLNSMSAT